jgi:hypothetical protein
MFDDGFSIADKVSTYTSSSGVNIVTNCPLHYIYIALRPVFSQSLSDKFINLRSILFVINTKPVPVSIA